MNNLSNQISFKYVIFLFAWLILQPVNKANAWNSIMEFENRSDTGSFFDYLDNLSFCFSDDLIMNPLDYPDVGNTYMPPVLGVNIPPVVINQDVDMLNMMVVNGLRMVVYLQMLNSPLAGLAVLGMGAELLVMIEVCTNSYIVQPWEYVNRENGWLDCQGSKGNIYNASSKALTATDIPFYYSCNPKYNPPASNDSTAGTEIDIDSPNAVLIGQVWGYMGVASPYCVGNRSAIAKSIQQYIGMVRVEATHGWDGRFWTGYDRCSTSDRRGVWLKAGELGRDGLSVDYYAYYHFDTENSKIKLCVITPYTLLPISIGCSQVAPPGETNAIDPWLAGYTEGTRCYYFLTGRTDLWSLGSALPQSDSTGHSGNAIKGFLQSDFHITSTVIGCINDLIIKVFLSPDNKPGGYLNTGFFPYVQSYLKSIVYAALTLYVALLGIKIMSSPQVPSQGEFIMFVIKFGLVAYFITPSAWYYVEDGKAQGLFPTLVWASDEFAGYFLAAENGNDPVGLCSYMLQGSQLLGHREIDPSSVGSSVTATIGSNMLELTIWDLVDCKLMNYMNFGSCDYSLAGIIGVWISTAAMLVGGNGFLLAAVTLIYTWILLLVVFKFAHIFILSVFMIAILVLMSPIFLCFALFEVTKPIFQNWIKMILGYILYPALLFAFVSIMLMTFDSIYFGEFTLENTQGQTLTSLCKGIESIYCTTINYLVADPCTFTVGTTSAQLTQGMDLGPLGTFTTLKSEAASNYLDVVVKMMLFALLFYFFLGAVTSFLAVLTGVQDLGSLAKGSFDLMAMARKLGGKLLGKAGEIAGNAVSKITSSTKGGGG